MKKIPVIILCFWLLIICLFVLKQEYTIQTGREILLRTIPVDPVDILRGDYVILNYEISQIPDYYNFENNETVYVILQPNRNNIAIRNKIVRKKPSNALYLKGKTGKCQTTVPFYKTGKCVTFGIESYFVKEGAGKILESDLNKGAFVKVIVDNKGSAKIKGFVNY